MVFDRSGKMTGQFIVELTGTFANESRLILDETFRWNNGEQTSRIWTIDREQVSTITTHTGSAADVRGEGRRAQRGQQL